MALLGLTQHLVEHEMPGIECCVRGHEDRVGVVLADSVHVVEQASLAWNDGESERFEPTAQRRVG